MKFQCENSTSVMTFFVTFITLKILVQQHHQHENNSQTSSVYECEHLEYENVYDTSSSICLFLFSN